MASRPFPLVLLLTALKVVGDAVEPLCRDTNTGTCRCCVARAPSRPSCPQRLRPLDADAMVAMPFGAVPQRPIKLCGARGEPPHEAHRISSDLPYHPALPAPSPKPWGRRKMAPNVRVSPLCRQRPLSVLLAGHAPRNSSSRAGPFRLARLFSHARPHELARLGRAHSHLSLSFSQLIHFPQSPGARSARLASRLRRAAQSRRPGCFAARFLSGPAPRWLPVTWCPGPWCGARGAAGAAGSGHVDRQHTGRCGRECGWRR